MDLSPDGNKISVGTLDRFSSIYNVSNDKLSELASFSGCVDLHWSPSGNRLLAAAFRARIVSLSDAARPPIQADGAAESLWIDAPTGIIAEAKGRQIIHWSIATGRSKLFQTLEGHFQNQVNGRLKRNVIGAREVWVDSVTGAVVVETPTELGTANECIAVGSNLFALREARNIYLYVPGQKPTLISDKAQTLYSAPSGNLMILGLSSGLVQIWNRVTDRWVTVDSFAPFTLHDARFMPDEEAFLGAFDNGRVSLIDTHSGKVLRNFDRHAGNASRVALSPDGRRVVTGGDDQTVRIWDFHTGRLLSVLKGHVAEICQIDFLENRRTIVTRDTSGQVRVWRTTSDGL